MSLFSAHNSIRRFSMVKTANEGFFSFLSDFLSIAVSAFSFAACLGFFTWTVPNTRHGTRR